MIVISWISNCHYKCPKDSDELQFKDTDEGIPDLPNLFPPIYIPSKNMILFLWQHYGLTVHKYLLETSEWHEIESKSW